MKRAPYFGPQGMLPGRVIIRKKRREQPEAALQKAVAQFLKAALGKGVMWRMIENRPRSKIAGAAQKKRGIEAGTPDVLLWAYDFFGAIELKSGRGSLSSAQKKFRDEFLEAGGMHDVCRSVGEVECALLNWRLPLKGTVRAK
jgi:hypothetical protein